MKASIDVHMIINGTKSLKRGEFQIRKDEDIPVVTYNWIRKIRRESGYYGTDSIIEKVIVDNEKDITDKVKEIDEAPLKW